MMLFSSSRRIIPASLFCLFLALLAFFTPATTSVAQDQKQTLGNGDLVARGKYIVEDVAMCGTCHTPRRADGSLDRSQWLAGAPVPYQPAQANSNWPINAPRLAGNPPASNAQMVTLLTTAVWITGQPLRDPMPKFHMSRADAEAVVAYLRSLNPGR